MNNKLIKNGLERLFDNDIEKGRNLFFEVLDSLAVEKLEEKKINLAKNIFKNENN